MIRRRHVNDDGSLSLFAVVVAAALLVALGLVVDGGAELAAHRRATAVAEEAARAGSQALDTASLRAAGTPRLDPALAVTASRGYLASAGVAGAVRADPGGVSVDVTLTRPTTVLGIIGIHTVTARGHARARLAPGITTDEGTP